jgi:hypothetical protein
MSRKKKIKEESQELLTSPATTLQQIESPPPAEIDTLHKQPRSYLKTSAKLVGKATGETTLFSLPEVLTKEGSIREVISKNTAILGNLLFKLWQESKEEELIITNLSPIADRMKVNNYEIKIYLLYLGGYVYPIIDKDDSGGLTLSMEQLFKIKFFYGSKVREKYPDLDSIPQVGTGLLTSFIKDESADRIVIKPNELFIKALQGEGLGNVFVTDKFIQEALSLTDIGYKILSYSASNKPKQKIAESNLIKHLGMEEKVKTQGKPRIRTTILKGLQELQDNGLIDSFQFIEAKGMYEFIYSGKIIRHKELLKEPENEA